MKDIKDILDKVENTYASKYSDAQLMAIQKRTETNRKKYPHLYDETWAKDLYDYWVQSQKSLKDIAKEKKLSFTSLNRAFERFQLEFPREILEERWKSHRQQQHKRNQVDEKIQDIKNGMTVREFSEKWGVSKRAFYNIRRRYCATKK
jgi:tRNA G10  N-methylase Trm11